MNNLLIISATFLVVFLFYSCKKDKPIPPIISTASVTEISYTTAISGGNVINEGSSPVVTKGVCWNTSGNPTSSDSKTVEGSGSGGFIK